MIKFRYIKDQRELILKLPRDVITREILDLSDLIEQYLEKQNVKTEGAVKNQFPDDFR
ncbi:MAG: hypothetical protein OXH65_02920 [Paracoccaceae bacterium]|nr:hypothetical protein [Paracoccaceae bacterium]